MLEWNVYKEDFNSKCIKIFNVFDHHNFIRDLQKIHKKYKKKDDFCKELRKILLYYFWSKCEYEIILSDWPPSKEERGFKKEKVSIYDQIENNWNIFADYVWDNRKEIKKYDI